MNTLLDLPQITKPLIDAYLADQQSLTAVERFARLHELGALEQHAAKKHYHGLIPLTAPQPGEQYAFAVDLDACSGCKACVTACHRLNGLDDGETFRDVGALTGRERGGLHVLQHVTTACHHCLEPACLSGCPTRAYDKDPVTGIVRHLDDQCIGCQYCTLMCPYDVPKYNSAKGIVRKCDMCRQRLEGGEAPACVQACPNQAIRIEIVRIEEIRQHAAGGQFLPHAPEPSLTLPSTTFVTSRATLRDVEPVAERKEPSQPHFPLVVMLVLTQMSMGMMAGAEGMLLAGENSGRLALAALAIGVAGLAVAVLHLGRPQIAYRAWLGWRTSWMSREIIAIHVWLAMAIGFAMAVLLGATGVQHGLGMATAVCAVAAIVSSAMIYAATRREFWAARRTIPQFLATALVLGLAGTLASLAGNSVLAQPIVATLALAALIRLAADCVVHSNLGGAVQTLLDGPLSGLHSAQAAAAMVGGLVLPAVMLSVPQFRPVLAVCALLLLLAAELIQRALFFMACPTPHMPGVPQG